MTTQCVFIQSVFTNHNAVDGSGFLKGKTNQMNKVYTWTCGECNLIKFSLICIQLLGINSVKMQLYRNLMSVANEQARGDSAEMAAWTECFIS